jgi:2-keto-myo-inositol isomerase
VNGIVDVENGISLMAPHFRWRNLLSSRAAQQLHRLDPGLYRLRLTIHRVFVYRLSKAHPTQYERVFLYMAPPLFPFKAALNTSTFFPFKLDIKQQVRIAAEAGYAGIELWMKDLESYLASGGTIRELRSYIADTGIAVVNAIAFFKWADADHTTRQAGLIQAEREMRLLAELGCPAVAAPPYGDVEGVTLEAIAEHFARLAGLARGIGVEPYLEFWGRAKRLSRLSEAVFVAMESGLPDVKILLDPFHMYTGGSELGSLSYLSGAHIGIVHVNDYPAAPARDIITDGDRVYPGDGIAPTHELARILDRASYRGYLSLELFVEHYGAETALAVAERGLAAIQNAYRVDG